MKTATNSFIAITLIFLTMTLTGCSNSGSGPSAGNTENIPDGKGGCSVELAPSSDNIAVAKAFNDYRLRCHPSESEFEQELAKLN